MRDISHSRLGMFWGFLEREDISLYDALEALKQLSDADLARMGSSRTALASGLLRRFPVVTR